MRVETLTTLDDLVRLEPAWAALFGRVPAAAPFASPAWLIPWWRIFAPGRLATLAVWEGDALVALAPLYVETGPALRRLLPLGIGLSDHMDVLIDPAHAAAAGQRLAEAIGATRRDWECWSAEEAAPGAAVLGLPEPYGCASTWADHSASPVLDLPGSGDTLDAVIPPRKRRKWRMALNRVGRRDWRIAATTPETLTEDLGHLFRLHGARWESRGEAGVLADARVQAFHAAAAPGLLDAGLLRLWTLRIDGTVAGAYYGFARPGAAYAYLGGFDPAFAFESPGTLLVGHAIESAWQDGAAAFQFLRGQEAYKYEWGAVDRWTRRRSVVPL
ncbi:GNAT family N-acetyltransferase [Lichenihabitans sp. Uapishka_5]|uniref:GNAT family N-acetyltransferase n=1 Tax=Lichenihabitans sp. Uapishka_5 TaxID=3037302 RepID=UPI0029E7CF5F|nr:GNAT family N-acetyltransferase [Lichenihabitans sp. Uapishka_5]MDX7952033.1 GNAT family N-acetyltransferase [Lichenihabitans sp. Uapishka_5]